MSKEEKTKMTKQEMLDKTMNVFAKIGNQRHLSSIRDGFATFLPFIIVGSFGVMLNSVFFSSTGLIANYIDNESVIESWKVAEFYLAPIANAISGATMDMMALYVSFLIGYFLTGTYGENKIFGGMVAMVSFIALGPIIAAGGGLENLSAKGVLLALIAALVAPTIYVKLVALDAIKIKMPPGVPQAVSNSFNSLIPIILTITVMALIQPVWGGFSYLCGFGKETLDVNTLAFTVDYTYTSALGEELVKGTEEISISSGQLFDYVNGIINVNGSAIDTTDAYFVQLVIDQLSASHENWSNFAIGSVGTIDANSFSIVKVDDINSDWYYFFNMIKNVLFTPLSTLANGPFAILIVMLAHQMFWVFGIHGGNILNPFIYTFWITASVENTQMLSDTLAQGGNLQDLIATGELASWTSTSMDNIVGQGGSGATLGFMFCLVIFSKDESQKQLAKLEIPVGIFGINEPAIFGLPIMLNPFYLVPWLTIAPFWSLTTYFVTEWGWMNPTTLYIPWTTPPFLGPLLTTQDWRSLILSGLIFTTSFLGYWPFAIMEFKAKNKIAAEEAGVSYEEYMVTVGERNQEIKEKNLQEKEAKKQEKEAKKAENDKKKGK